MTNPSSMTRFRIALALALIIVAVVMVAGCDYVPPEYNIVLIKLHPDGSVGWSKIFEDKAIKEMVETADGSYIITYTVVTHRPEHVPDKIIRLSKNGDQIWEQSMPASPDIQCLNQGLISTSDDGFAFAAARGGVCLFTAEGNVLWDRGAGIIYPDESFIQTKDGGFLIVGDYFGNSSMPTVKKLDSRGFRVWEHSVQARELDNAQSIIELPDDLGFLVSFDSRHKQEVKDPLYIAQLDKNGIIINYSLLSPDGWFSSGITHTTSDESVIFYHNFTGIKPNYNGGYPIVTYLNNTNTAGFMDRNGHVKRSVILPNYSVPIIPAPDEGYLFAGFKGEGNQYYGNIIKNVTDSKLHVVKLNSMMTQEWEKEIPEIKVSSVGKIIPLKDDGYIILCGTPK